MNTSSPQELHTTESNRELTSATNVGPASSGSKSTPLERVKIEDSTAKFRSTANTSKAALDALNSANLPRPSTELDAATISQKEVQSTELGKTLVDDSTSASESQPSSLERAEDSTTKSSSKANTLKAAPALESANPPHPSTEIDAATISQKEVQSTKPRKTLVDDSTSASKSQPSLLEQAENSTTKSGSKADTSKAAPALESANLPRPSTEIDAATISQKKVQSTEPRKTLVDDSTSTSELQHSSPEWAENLTTKSGSKAKTSKAAPAPERANPSRPSTEIDAATISQTKVQSIEPGKTGKTLVDESTSTSELQHSSPEWNEDSTTKSGSKANTSKAAPAPERANPSQPSTELDTTTSSQKKIQSTEPGKTLVDDSTSASELQRPSPERAEDSTTKSGSKADALKGSQCRAGPPPSTELDTYSLAPLFSTSVSISCLNIKSSGTSTSLTKLQEKTEVNKLPQKEGLCSTEDANKQKARDSAQVADGQATTPSKKNDVSQQIANYEEAIRDLKAKITNMETFAYQQAGEHRKEISRLEAKIDQQKQEYKEEIDPFKAKISIMEAWLFSKEHGPNTEHKQEIERLKGKHDEEIRGLNVIIANKDEQVLKLEKELEKEIERLKGKHDEEIRGLNVIIANKDEQILKLEKELEKDIERLQPKVSSEADAKQSKTGQAMDPTMNLEKKPIDSNQAPPAQAIEHSGTPSNQKINGLDQQPGNKKEKNKSLATSGKQANESPPQSVIPKADSLSVTDVANLVKALNAEIGQLVHLLMEPLSGQGPSVSANESEIAVDELRNYLGPWLCDKLRGNSEPDDLITQVALHAGLANTCSSVVNDSPFWCDGSILHQLYRRIAEKESQTAANEWRAKAANYLDLPQYEDANKKYLTEVLLKVATAAVRGTLKSSEILISQYSQQVEVIAKAAAKLHKIIIEDVTSSELITYTVYDTTFDPSLMEDTENNQRSTSRGKVTCTQDMGLLCRKRAGPKKPRGSLKDWGVTMKANVVLAATLEAQ